MKLIGLAFVVGLVMAIALGFAGMTQPSKVIGFLDFFGDFDPSLAFVMAGAIGVHFVSYRLIAKRNTPLLDGIFHWPEHKLIDARLLAGAAIFGVGWGMSGFCPGPAITALATGLKEVFIFVIAMGAGQLLYTLAMERRRA